MLERQLLPVRQSDLIQTEVSVRSLIIVFAGIRIHCLRSIDLVCVYGLFEEGGTVSKTFYKQRRKAAASMGKRLQKTYNSGYSLVVTHLTTNPPVRCLNRTERTGSLVFNVLWSYVEDVVHILVYICGCTVPQTLM
jgi:hypothetical protein